MLYVIMSYAKNGRWIFMESIVPWKKLETEKQSIMSMLIDVVAIVMFKMSVNGAASKEVKCGLYISGVHVSLHRGEYG